jgi:hypothetical protein
VKRNALLLMLLLGAGMLPHAEAADENEFKMELEIGPAWQSRNDARIPNRTGTDFSLRNIQGSGPFAAARVSMDYAIAPKHEFRLLLAPLTIQSTGELNQPVFFDGTGFAVGPGIKARYEFNSYRLTYRYRIYAGNRWAWKLGVTGKIRDAKIELSSSTASAAYTDLGFVPLVHLDGEYKISDRWKFHLNVDGLGAPQGRAVDFLLQTRYNLSRKWTIGAGYRMLEGGADVDDVYTFAWLHYATVSLSYAF